MIDGFNTKGSQYLVVELCPGLAEGMTYEHIDQSGRIPHYLIHDTPKDINDRMDAWDPFQRTT